MIFIKIKTMKKTLLIGLSVLFFTVCNGQENFVWDKTDSVNKTKDQIYSDTKLFIAKTWNSAKHVIQNDDKEGGIIFVRAINIQNVSYALFLNSYTYNYDVTFKMKDFKCKIIIDNVICKKAITSDVETGKIQPFEKDDDFPKGTFGQRTAIPKKKGLKMMKQLKFELQEIVTDYENYIKNSRTDNW